MPYTKRQLLQNCFWMMKSCRCFLTESPWRRTDFSGSMSMFTMNITTVISVWQIISWTIPRQTVKGTGNTKAIAEIVNPAHTSASVPKARIMWNWFNVIYGNHTWKQLRIFATHMGWRHCTTSEKKRLSGYSVPPKNTTDSDTWTWLGKHGWQWKPRWLSRV